MNKENFKNKNFKVLSKEAQKNVSGGITGDMVYFGNPTPGGRNTSSTPAWWEWWKR